MPVGPMPARNDVVYRSGGSLRAKAGAGASAESVCRGGEPGRLPDAPVRAGLAGAVGSAETNAGRDASGRGPPSA